MTGGRSGGMPEPSAAETFVMMFKRRCFSCAFVTTNAGTFRQAGAFYYYSNK
ncbi:hypothetical protein B4090_4069 [Bacillus licheniformis]|nr:hypothetical protein B4090_4069 [Bacillus licheniformis]